MMKAGNVDPCSGGSGRRTRAGDSRGPRRGQRPERERSGLTAAGWLYNEKGRRPKKKRGGGVLAGLVTIYALSHCGTSWLARDVQLRFARRIRYVVERSIMNKFAALLFGGMLGAISLDAWSDEPSDKNPPKDVEPLRIP